MLGLDCNIATIANAICRKPGDACDNPFYSREPDEIEQRGHAWCAEKGFHAGAGSRDAPHDYPVNQRMKRIELGFERRSFIEFDFLVSCETDGRDSVCSRNLMLTGKAPKCNQLVSDKDNDGVCDKLDECMWDSNDEKDSSTGACLITSDVRSRYWFRSL